ncbi:MAG: oligopeptide/dipeptide ABC transporter ATP-binding protein [Candidatus Desulfovibrio kirbyi]|uniref:Nickel import system ATP-binding protein NikD n=1 Tax=Candidatus Desulfovibrio kirbyi TaxID=2696086 RepID=A0A6L2R667_9BACT|nr:MAG: oligopeptide/dipeptide ABC transporter ATP-binding protein [Candidatus Desulfovibrio kirbyi]
MNGLTVDFISDKKRLTAVNNVSLALYAGAITCLVGESGCGKSLTARAILRLTPETALTRGQIFLGQTDLLSLPEKALRDIRGHKIGMVFQEPMTSLNPVLTVGEQTAEPLRLHLNMTADEARGEVERLFSEVGIPSPRSRYDEYPHQLSGGMRQRVMIAMALACKPDILLADEPTTALDATIQGQILRLISDQTQRRGMAVLLITHDLAVVAQTADFVGVMYAGNLMEYAAVGEFFTSPQHPYSRALMECAAKSRAAARLTAIEGNVPSLAHMPSGCAFHPRCPMAEAHCAQATPDPLALTDNTHRVACLQAEKKDSA